MRYYFLSLLNFFSQKRRIYLDYAATTPLSPGVFRVMKKIMRHYYHNPSAWYQEGVTLRTLIADARKQVASLLGTTSDHIVFTRGGTESCNLALQGVLEHALRTSSLRPHVITTTIEHPAVREVLEKYIQQDQIDISYVSVQAHGCISAQDIKKLLRPETILVSVMYVNNEIGTVQPIQDIAKTIRWFKKQNMLNSKGENSVSYPLFHTDAIQASAYQELHVDRLGIDLMSFSGSKIYGPKSSGVLYVRTPSLLDPQFFGGDQEHGLRAGTEDGASLIGYAHALQEVRARRDSEVARLTILRDLLTHHLVTSIPDLIVNHSVTQGSPHIVHVTVPGISGERLVLELDAQGIAVSSRAACSQDDISGTGSEVLRALREAQGKPFIPDEGSLRLSLGKDTTRKEVLTAARIVADRVRIIRSFEERLTSWGKHVE